MKATVYHNVTATFGIKVEIPDDTPVEERADAARAAVEEVYSEQAPSGLCHHCAGSYDLGEPAEDMSEYGVYVDAP
jgi:hypothetical protein